MHTRGGTPRIAVLTNVESGRNRRGRYLGYHLPDIVGGRGLVIETETVEEIGPAIDRFIESGAELICLNGGDGTVQRTLTHLINRFGEGSDSMPLVFPLRGGTLNVLAANLGIKGKPGELAGRVVRLVEHGGELPFATVPTLRLKREFTDSSDLEYGFFFGNGALYRFDRVYYRQTDGGPVAAAGLFCKCVAGGATGKTRYAGVFGATPMRVSVDGFEMPGTDFTIVLAVSLKRVVLTFNPFREGDGGDFYVLATSVPFVKMVSRLDRLLWVRGDRAPYPREVYWNSRGSELVIDNREGYTLDGEVFLLEEPYRLTITRGPDIRVLSLRP